jgi:hypothetical protein
MRRRCDYIVMSTIVGGMLSGCTFEIVDALVGAAGLAEGESGVGSTESAGSEGADGAGAESEGSEPPPLFDVGSGEVQVTSCEFAAVFPSHLGCEFYGLDIDGPGLFDDEPYGFVIINPLPTPVTVELEAHSTRGWARGWTLLDTLEVASEGHHVVVPANNEVHLTGLYAGASMRITSTQPIVVVQAHPAAGQAISASATMLQPTTAWAGATTVAGWRTHLGVGERSFLGILTAASEATLTIKPSFDVADAPAQWADRWVDIDGDGQLELVMPLAPGELLRLDAAAIDAAEIDYGISGTQIDSGPHPSSAFSAHTCAAIPDYEGTCGHMQEQLSAALVGRRFVAPRLVASAEPGGPGGPLVHERTMIQVVALEPETEVVFSVHEGGETLTIDLVVINPDDPYAIYEAEHEVAITANKPIIAAAYMTNATHTPLGSPSMVQLAPLARWTGHHWVWAPAGFETHLLVASRPGADVEVQWLSGLAAADPPQPSPAPLAVEFVAAPSESGAPTTWVVRRFAVEPGIHRVESSEPASVVVAGWRSGDGFAYLGGWGPSFADFGPQG